MQQEAKQEPARVELMTIKDVMTILKVSRTTAYRLLRDWKVRKFRSGQIVRVDRSEFDLAVKIHLKRF